MSDAEWKCGDCGGEFPEPYIAQGAAVCPWCGKRLAKMFTPTDLQKKRLLRFYGIGEDEADVLTDGGQGRDPANVEHPEVFPYR